MKEGAIFRRGMVVVMLALAVTACIGKFRDASGVSNLEPPANAIPRSYFGMHFHRADRGTVWPAGRFGSWRLWDADVLWKDIQPTPERWDWRRLDAYITLAEKAGIDVIIPLAMPPGWASARPTEKGAYGNGSSAEPRDFNAWTSYVRAVAERYKGRVRWYEVWNEVNEPGYFTGTVQKMIELTREANRVVKEVDSANRILAPSTVGNHGWFEKFLAAGGGRFVDVITYHFYVTSEAPEAMLPTVLKVQDLMVRYGAGDKPLWNTETGWLIANADGSPFGEDYKNWITLTQEQAAAYVARSLVLGWASGIDRFYWYSWDHFDMGFVEPKARTIKLAGQAYLKTVQWLEGSRMERCGKERDVWSCRLVEASGTRTFLLWHEKAGNARFAIPDDWKAQSVHRLDGSSEALGSERAIDVGPMPIQLRTTL